MSTVTSPGDGPDGPVGPGQSGTTTLERGDRARSAVRVVGEVLITLGLVVLLFVVYEVYVTNLVSAGKQREAASALDERWRSDTDDAPERGDHFEGLGEGEGFAKMYVPAFGPDYRFTVLEGTTEKTLAVGPGHYQGTAYPGLPGNFAVAGHRVGKGAPFNDIDLLQSCDAIVVETHTRWFVYRVLPKADEVATWPERKSATPRCAAVEPLGAPYDGVVGQEIVSPRQGEVVLPVPGKPGAEASVGEQVGLMTLTTCHPRFSDRQRLIVHAVLAKDYPKDPAHPDLLPPELKETD